VVIEPLETERTFSAREPGRARCLNGFFGVELSQEKAKTLLSPEKIGAFVTVEHQPRPLNIKKLVELEEQQISKMVASPVSLSFRTEGRKPIIGDKTPLCVRSRFILQDARSSPSSKEMAS
jgi:hypothetical protein